MKKNNIINEWLNQNSDSKTEKLIANQFARTEKMRISMEKENNFRKDLEKLINNYSMENGSDTPDFILAEYLTDCLNVYDKTLQKREKWYGREIIQRGISITNDSTDSSQLNLFENE